MSTTESPQLSEDRALTEALYEETRRLGAQAAAADLPGGAVRQQSEVLCRTQGWTPSDPLWYEAALVAYHASVAAKQQQPLRWGAVTVRTSASLCRLRTVRLREQRLAARRCGREYSTLEQRGGRMTSLPTDRKIIYLFQYRTCGKPGCSRCQRGPGHGPYWYAYWREQHRTRSGYVGKTLPAGLHQALRQNTHHHTTEEECR